MTAHPLDELRPVENRPGMLGRTLIGTEHGVTSFFVAELVMEPGSAIPLHTHPVEEAFLVAEGALTVRLGEQVVRAEANTVVQIPAGVPHAVLNADNGSARALAGAPWNRRTFFSQATTYLEGQPRE